MLHYLVLFLIVFHAGIHLLGTFKAFELAALPELRLPISPAAGRMWLTASLLFFSAGLAFWLQNSWWLVFLGIGIVLSQALIISYWQGAKFGTISNVMLILVWIAGFSAYQFEADYRRDVAQVTPAQSSAEIDLSILTQEDINHLPDVVQQYLYFTGSVGQAKVHNFRVKMRGQMRQAPTSEWFDLKSEQYNSLQYPTRLFFMKANPKGIPTAGYHSYQNSEARMLVKVLSTFPVVDINNALLFKAETVTFLNDMCLMAPAMLIDPRITWEEITADQVRATFRNGAMQIQAILAFSPDGQLVNFFSEDRVDINAEQTFLFSTPIYEYRDFGGYCLPAYGEAIWHYPDTDFPYGRFRIQEVSYNVNINPAP